MVNFLEATFPGLAKSDYAITSPSSKRYNCIAWAAGDTDNWWWPSANAEVEYWPATVIRVETVDAFREVYGAVVLVMKRLIAGPHGMPKQV
jgi:hypothetical protein